jgi:hypothetical protein
MVNFPSWSPDSLRSAVELHACAQEMRRWRSRVNPACSTSLKGSRTTRFSKRTHTSHGETLVTCPIAPAGILTGGSSSHLSLTRCPTAKFPFPMALEPVNLFVLYPPFLRTLFPEAQRMNQASFLAGVFRSPAHRGSFYSGGARLDPVEGSKM